MSKTKPKVIVFSGYGLNCEEETLFAFKKVGIDGDIVHLNDVIKTPTTLRKYNILAMPGGFSYGDDTGSGRAYANKVSNHLREELEKFVKRNTLTIGICNGFQILTHIGLLSGALTHNDNARYIDRWVDCEVTNDSPWLKGITHLSMPIAHGEGKYIADAKTLKDLKDNSQIALKYIKGDISSFNDLDANPNGSLQNIASITSHDGRVIGLMPHPERSIFFEQLPNWTNIKDESLRNKKPLPKEGPGLAIFKNAKKYFG